jgi:hypothetical protein
VYRKIGQQGDWVEKPRPGAIDIIVRMHHSTQQVTNRGTSSPLLTIQIVLIIAWLACRLTGTSRRQWVPQ